MFKIFRNMDKGLFVATILLVIIGLFMIFSASSVSTILRYEVGSSHFFTRQLIFVLLAFAAAFLVILRLDTSHYYKFTIPAYLGSVGLLAGLFISGKVTNNAASWYDLGFFSLQPSEFTKIILIVVAAVHYSAFSHSRITNKLPYIIVMLLCLVPVGLVFVQPDLGSAIIMCGIVFLMFLGVPVIVGSGKLLLVLMFIGIPILGIGCYNLLPYVLEDYQLDRFTFTKPCDRYIDKTGYQVCNGFIAMNNGEFLETKLGESTQKYLYLPESHTDFIFPIIVEELGFVFSTLIICLYIYILYRMIVISRNVHNLRCSLLAYGSFIFWTAHILINLFGVLAIIPLTGVPLPLLSYGGSSTITFLIAVFICLRVSIENNEVQLKKDFADLSNKIKS